MDERESLGKLAYETFVGTRDGSVPLAGDIQSWEEQSDSWRHCWIAVAQAVAERERGGERMNNEVDEIKPVSDDGLLELLPEGEDNEDDFEYGLYDFWYGW